LFQGIGAPRFNRPSSSIAKLHKRGFEENVQRKKAYFQQACHSTMARTDAEGDIPSSSVAADSAVIWKRSGSGAGIRHGFPTPQ
jgi:hypothetical protein